MPRTTVDIDASVLRELRKRQRREQKTLGQLVSELLARAMQSGEDQPPDFAWLSTDLKPRVDLEDKDTVWSILDER